MLHLKTPIPSLPRVLVSLCKRYLICDSKEANKQNAKSDHCNHRGKTPRPTVKANNVYCSSRRKKKKKKTDRSAYLICFRIYVRIFNEKSSSPKLILQLIQVKVYNFDTLPVHETVQSIGILPLRDTQISRGVSSRINIC